MSSFIANFSTAPHGYRQTKFVPYIPASTRPKRTTTKRKAERKALEHKSSDEETHEGSAGAKNLSILPEATPESPCISNLESPTLLATAESGFLLNDEVVHSGSVALGPDLDRCDWTFPTEDVAITERYRSTSIDYDFGRLQSHWDMSCEFPSDGGYLRTMQEDPQDTELSTPSIYDTNSDIIDVPTLASCSSAASSISLGKSERLRSSPVISIVAAKNSILGLQSDHPDDFLESWIAPNTLEASLLPNGDACVSEFRPDCNEKPTVSTVFTASNADGSVGNAPESEVRPELLQSTDEFIPLSRAEDQDLTSESTDSRREPLLNDITVTNSLMEGSRAPSRNEEDRYIVEKIVDHDDHEGRKRYRVKWQGFSEGEMTWEPEDNLDGCTELLQDYWDREKYADSTSNAIRTGARPSPSSGGMRDDLVSLPYSAIRIIHELEQNIFRLRSSLGLELVQSETSDRAASRCTARKRKLLQGGECFSNQDQEDLDTHLDSSPRTKVRKGGDEEWMVACRKSGRRCKLCRRTGHNARTCSGNAVSTND